MSLVIRCLNIPFSLENARITNNYQRYFATKLWFYKHKLRTLAKPTQPYKRLDLDFKGPLPTKTKNKYILKEIDEYSRFLFVFPCLDDSAETVIQYVFSLF